MLSSKSCLKVVEEGIGQGYMYGNIGPNKSCDLGIIIILTIAWVFEKTPISRDHKYFF